MSEALSSPTAAEALAGLVERVTYHNAENGFCVLRVKARGQRDLVTLVGHTATITAGEWLQASGSWVNDRSHGLQFRAHFLRATAPTTLEGIEKYLGSGMIRGVGPVYARKLVAAFGEHVFDLIEQEPGRLREVAGIGPVRAQRIVAGWAEQKVIREIMLFLHSHGVGTSRAVRIFKTYGPDAVGMVSENPYRLARDIRGIGFRTADQIAQRLGIERTAMIRVRSGISFALAEAMDEGHCGLPEADLIEATSTLLEVDAALVTAALAEELKAGEVVADTLDGRPCIFLAGLHRAEREIAERLRALAAAPPPWPVIDADRALPWVQERTGLALAPSQQAALRHALLSKVLVITGGPGVGKTTLVNSILRVLAAKGCASRCAVRPDARPSACLRARDCRPGPFTVCWRPTQRQAGSSAARTPRSTASCWWWTRPAWWTCRSYARFCARCRPGRRCCWWATWTSCLQSGRGRCWRT